MDKSIPNPEYYWTPHQKTKKLSAAVNSCAKYRLLLVKNHTKCISTSDMTIVRYFVLQVCVYPARVGAILRHSAILAIKIMRLCFIALK